MTVHRSAGQPPSPEDQPIRWSYLVGNVLDRWDRTGRLIVLAFALTACITVVLGVMPAGAVALTVAGLLAPRARRTAVAGR